MARRRIIEQALIAEKRKPAAGRAGSSREDEGATAEIEYPHSDGQPMAENYQQHRTITYASEALEAHFRRCPDVHVRGDMNLYYVEGDSGSKVVPDLMVTREVEDVPVTSYQTWKVGVPPQFVMEVLSPSTYVEDKGDKKDLYQRLGVDEYWLFDPQGGLLDPKGDRLIAGYSLDGGTEYGEIQPDPVVMLRSKVLELDICSVDGFLRVWDYENGELLGSLAEERGTLAS